MLKVELLEMIRTGRFGPVSIDDSRERLLKKIGKPECSTIFDVESVEKYEVLKYNWWEFTLCNGILFRYQNKYALDRSYKFDYEFLTKPGNFKINSWFNDIEYDTKIEPLKEKLIKSGIHFIREPFYDTIRLLIDYNKEVEIEIQFHSEIAFHKNPDEWNVYTEKELNWKFGAIYVTKKTN